VWSIRLVVTLVAASITAAAVLAVGVAQEHKARRILRTELEARLLEEGRHVARVASVALLEPYPELTLHPLVKSLLDGQEELALAVVIDHDGLQQGAYSVHQLGLPYELPSGLSPYPTDRPLSEGETMLADSELLLVSIPVHHSDGRRIGEAMVGLRQEYLDALMAGTRRQGMILMGCVLAVGVGVTLLVLTLLLRPFDALRAGLERIGRGDLETRLDLPGTAEFTLLAQSVNSMAVQLKKAQEERVEKERLTHELDLAREIQRSLLPTSQARLGNLVVCGSQRAAAEVGGDYYDFLPLSDGRLAVAIADVAGKGLGGCLVMSMLSALLRAFTDDFDSPSALIAELDAKLTTTLRPGTFITLFFGILDPEDSSLTFASAGHSPTLIYRSETGRTEQFRTRGIPVGAIRGGAIRSTLEDHVITIGPGDVLVQYTDGITEAFDPAGREQFGMERLEALLTEGAPEGGLALLNGVRAEIDKWMGDARRFDDETLLIVASERNGQHRSNGSEEGSPIERLARPEEWLRQAWQRGKHISLETSGDRVEELRAWLDAQEAFAELSPDAFELVVSSLYEIFVNVVEHGHGGRSGHRVDLWWVPRLANGRGGEPGCAGHFVVRDQGTAFAADNWRRTDFSDRSVWRRGRGFGLDIIHRAMAQVGYAPGTPEGNVMLLAYDPGELRFGEKKHA
jgi:serine phosphatase RsbU (regulator of sigma subunit)